MEALTFDDVPFEAETTKSDFAAPAEAPPEPPPEVATEAVSDEISFDDVPMEDSGWLSVAGRAAYRGAADAITGVGQTGEILTGDADELKPETAPSDDPELDRLLNQTLGEGWSDPNWWVSQVAYGVTSSSPSLAGGIGGAAAGGAAAGPGGALAGGIAGGAAGAMIQTLGPAYVRALSDGLDQDEAFERAWVQTGVAGVFGGIAGALPMGAVFGKSAEGALKAPIKEALFQMFVAQPGAGVAEEAVQTKIEGDDVTLDKLATAYVGEAAAGAVMDTGAKLATGGFKPEVLPESGSGSAEDVALKGNPINGSEAGQVDPAIAQAVAETPVETPRERALRIAKERDRRVATGTPAAPKAPAATPTQPADAVAAGTEPSDAVGATPAAPPSSPPASQLPELPVGPDNTAAAPSEPATSGAAAATPPTVETPTLEAPPAETPAEEAKPTKSELFDKAVDAVLGYNNASVGFLIGRLGIGEKRARKLQFELEDAGIISKPNQRGIRSVVKKPVTSEGNLDTGTVQEGEETLQAQRQALAEGKRRAVFYPEGTQALAPPQGPNIKRFKIEKIGIFDYDASKIEAKELREAAKDGRLNEVLDLGPVNKDEVAQSAAAGNQPVAVVERTPEGTEVKAAAGTTETAPAQIDTFKNTAAAPENTVTVEDPRQVVADRQEASGPRVLPDISPEGIAKRQAVQEAKAKLEAERAAKEKAAAEEAAMAAERAAKKTQNQEELQNRLNEQSFESVEEEALARATAGGSSLQPRDRDAIVKGAAIAKDVFDRAAAAELPDVVATAEGVRQLEGYFAQVLALARQDFITAQRQARVAGEGKLTDREERAFSIRGKADYTTVTDHNVWLSEVAQLARSIAGAKSDKKFQALIGELNDFLENTRALKKGDGKPLRAQRQQQGAAIKASRSTDTQTDRKELNTAEDMEFTESVRDEENAAGGRAFDTAADNEASTDSPDAKDSPVEVTDREPVDPRTRWREVRDMRRAAAGKAKSKPKPVDDEPSYTTPKVTKAFVTEKKRKILKRESIDGEENIGELQDGDVLQEVTFAEALANSDEVRGNNANKTIINRILTRLGRTVGKTPVKIVSQDALDAMFPDRPGKVDGFYDADNGYIVMSERYVATGSFDSQFLAHEGVHAYLQGAIESDSNLKKDIQDILEFTREQSSNKKLYGFKNVHEFLSEALSNPAFQNHLMGIKVPARLASKFDMPKGGSLWEAMIHAVKKHLGLGNRDVDALSYVLRLADRASAVADKKPSKGKFMARERDYGQELRDAGVPDDVAQELNDFINAELGKAIDPSTVGLLMGDLIAAYGAKKVTSESMPKGKATRLRNLAIKTNTLDYIRQQYNPYFNGLLDKFIKPIQKRDNIVAETSERHDRDAADFMELMRRDRQQAMEMASIAMEATRLNVQVGPNGDNTHLGKNAKRGLQGKKRLKELNKRFDLLKPETQELYQRMVANYRETHNNNIRALAYNILTEITADNRLSNSDLMMLIDKVVAGTLTQADADLIGNADLFKELRAATSLKTIKGDYFPQMRFGDFVVLSEDKVPPPGIASVTLKGSGQTVPVKSWVEGGTAKFKIDPTVRGAQVALDRTVTKYIQDNDLTLLGVRKTWVDRQTGRPTPKGEQALDRDYDVVYEVDLQNKGVNFFESRKEAEKFRAEMKAANGDNLAKLSEVLDRRVSEGESFSKMISGSALTQVTKRIDAKEGIPAWQKKQMHALVEQAIISQMVGNRAQARHMARRNVKGASQDIARSAVTYGQSAGNYYATLTTAPEIRKAFTELERFESANEAEQGAGVRSQVMKELRKRQEGLGDPLYLNKYLQNVATLSFLDKLVSPAYLMINFTQVVGNTLPYLGGKYGNIKTGAAITAAYAKMGVGSVTLGGIKNTAKAAKGWQKSWLDTEDLVGSVRKKLGPKYDALIDEMVERGLLEPNSGFEIGQAVSEGAGGFTSALAKADRIARQAPASVEVANRMVTAVAAFDLATSQGNSIPQAIQEAYNTVSMTQGDYRGSNNPRFMRHPALSWAMQFKKYAVLQMQLVGDMYAKAFKGASKEERAVARKQLANMMAVQTMMAGALGIPGLELVKVSLMLLSVLFPDLGPDEAEEKLKEILDESIGQTASELIRKGVITRAIGIDVSSRMSQADLITGFTPDTMQRNDILGYAGSLLLGAPGSTLFDWADAAKLFVDGEFSKALEKAVPIKMASDTVRAYEQLQGGKMTPYEAAVKSIGFQPARMANIEEDRGAEIKESKKVSDERKKLFKAYINADTAGELAKVKARIREFNAEQPKKGRKLSIKSLEKLRQRELERYK